MRKVSFLPVLLLLSLSCSPDNKQPTIKDNTASNLVENLTVSKNVPVIQSLLNSSEITIVNNLLSSFYAGKFMDLIIKWKTLKVAWSPLTYGTEPNVTKIHFCLTDKSVEPWQLWFALPSTQKWGENFVILSYDEIKKYLIDICAKELWLSLSIQEAIAMVLYEEKNHLTTKKWELENDKYIISQMPEKYWLIKIYAMCRMFYIFQSNTQKKVLSPAYQQLSDYYLLLMGQVWVKDINELNIKELQKIRNIIKKDYK